MNKIPSDRVTDGIDQTALLLNGEGHSRRGYMVHYGGANIGAVRLGDYKAVMGGGVGGGLPQFEVYNSAATRARSSVRFIPTCGLCSR